MHNPRFSITQVLSTTVSGEMTRGHRFTYISVDADVVENTPQKLSTMTNSCGFVFHVVLSSQNIPVRNEITHTNYISLYPE